MAKSKMPTGDPNVDPGVQKIQVTRGQLEAASILIEALALVRGSKRAAQHAEGQSLRAWPEAETLAEQTDSSEPISYEAFRRAADAPVNYEDSVLKWQHAYRKLVEVCGGDMVLINAAYALARAHGHYSPAAPLGDAANVLINQPAHEAP